MENRPQKSTSDICLILEGTYPYVRGGVSGWVHQLIQSNPDFTFDLVCLVPSASYLTPNYEIPGNVVGKTDIVLQQLSQGYTFKKKEAETLIKELEEHVICLQTEGLLEALQKIIEELKSSTKEIGADLLLNSEQAWNMMMRMYHTFTPMSSFLNFFWSWRSFVGGLYSILLPPLPCSKVYHALCTGYAGICLCRAAIETKRPCILTEHGIYTNERRMEITIADWLNDAASMDLTIGNELIETGLKDYWINTFRKYSCAAYQAADAIITLYEGNKNLQILDGADPEKIQIIPNGIDADHYKQLRKKSNHPPTIAMIGRVVPIKDVKTCIRTTALIRESIQNIRSFILGPFDEDADYYEECLELADKCALHEHLTFTGNINVADYLKEVDVIILASISEAQPLVILEAGAAGIPCVSTDVGSCGELILGKNTETPRIGKGGAIANLYDPETIAKEVIQLLTDKDLYNSCSKNIRQRVETYYHIKDQNRAYREIYRNYMEQTWQE